jgi:hypothetical protein
VKASRSRTYASVTTLVPTEHFATPRTDGRSRRGRKLINPSEPQIKEIQMRFISTVSGLMGAHFRRAFAFLFLACAAAFATPTIADELNCNSDAAKRILMDSTFGKTMTILRNIDKALGPNSKQSSYLTAFFGITANIENVRQTGADGSGVSCAAEFTYQNMPPAVVTFAIGSLLQENGMQDATCEKLFVYKIERLLDKPGFIHVSWRCFNNGRWD